jgi:hypothetical protein
MSPKLQEKLIRLALLPLSAALIVATGCSNGSLNSMGTQSGPSGPAFLVGTDAPLASVVSFQVQVQSVELTGSGVTPANLISGTPTVDFARYNGLQTLLDMNDVPANTYTGVQIVLGTATIGYLNVPTCTPAPCTPAAPTISTETGTYPDAATTYTVNLTLDKPLVVSASGGQPVGLRMDFDLAKSIPVDTNGNFTNPITPTIDVHTIARTDTGAYIDTFVGGVVTLPTGGSSATEPNSFAIAGPHGENFTINTTSTTQWDGDASLATLSTNDIVEVSGQLDPADQTLDADEVAILSDSNFYATGQITYVTPASGAATNFDLYVRALEPTDVDSSVISLGQLAQVNLTGSEKYFVYWMHNPFTQFLFNSSSLVAGQDVAIGGPDTGVTSAGVGVKRIHLRNWGFNGTIVSSSQDSGNGSFQMQVNGFAGVLIPNPITVYLGGRCDFRYGFGAFSDLTNSTNIRVVGLLLKNPTTGQVILWARHVDGFEFTDFSTFAF